MDIEASFGDFSTGTAANFCFPLLNERRRSADTACEAASRGSLPESVVGVRHEARDLPGSCKKHP